MTHDVRPPFTYATLIRQVYILNKKIVNFLKIYSRLLLNLQILN
jgi:hypothetical protein